MNDNPYPMGSDESIAYGLGRFDEKLRRFERNVAESRRELERELARFDRLLASLAGDAPRGDDR